MKRTFDNCRLRPYENMLNKDGTCEGFQVSRINDEPYHVCRECKLHYLYKVTHDTPTRKSK